MESNKVRLTVMDNPFSTEKEIHEVERDTFRNLFVEHTRNKYPIEQAIFVDFDQRVTDPDTIPTSDHIIIKILPDGGTAEERKSSGKGFLAFAASVFLIAILVVISGGTLLAAGILAGTAVLFGGAGAALIVGANKEIAARRDKASNQIGIRGSKNRINLGGRIPIVLGRHLVFPDYLANPYVENIPNSDDQYVYMLFGFGYKDVKIDESTLKFGDLPFSNPAVIGAGLVKDVHYGSSTQHSLYSKRIRPTYPGTPIYNYPGESPAEVSELTSTTGSGTYLASVGLSFTSGIARYEKDSGDKLSYSIPINIVISPVEDPGVTAPVTSFTYTTKGSSTVGVSTSGSTLVFTDNRVKPMRRQVDIDLQSNLTVWNASPSKTFTITITASSTTKDPTYVVDRAVVEFINFTVFNGSGPTVGNVEVIPSDIKQKLTTMAVRVKSTDSLQGVLDEVSAVATLETRIYDPLATGTRIDKWQTLAQTQNPASAFVYLLTNELVNPYGAKNLSKVNWDSLGEFYDFCEGGGYSGGSSMKANMVIGEEIKLEEALSSVTSPFRSLWTIVDGKIRIITDKPNPYITQYFTPKNARDFNGNIVYDIQNDALRVSFVDETVWEDREIIVYRDPDNPTEEKIADLPVVAITTEEHAHFLAKYALATQSLRPEQFSFTADIESLVCVIGDRIQITTDAALIGLDTTTRVLGGIQDELDDTKYKYLIVDEEVFFEDGKDYGLVLRPQLDSETDGTDNNILRLNIVKPVSNVNTVLDGEGERYIFELETPVLKTKIYPQMLCMPGERGQETLDLIIQSIRMSDTHTAEIEGIPYSPEIYTAEQGPIPEYVNRITTPPQTSGDFNSTGVYDPARELAELQDIAREGIGKVSFGQLVTGLEDGEEITSLLPPNLALSSQGRTVAIAFAQPLGIVSSTYRHELQISLDQIDWFALNNPGSDPSQDPVGWQDSWKSSPDPLATIVYGYEYIHNRVPFAGTEGIPLARTYYYRARAVTGVSTPVYSAWQTYAITIQPLVTLDFDSGSITTDKLTANSITTDKLAAQSVTAEKLTANSITTDKLAAQSVTAEKLDVSLLTANNIQSPNYVANTTGFRISADGTLDFREGIIGGWLLDELTIKSQDANARVELNKEFNRIAIFDDNTTKVALGFLDGLQKQDGSGVWGPTDYGLWVRPGDTARFDGDINYQEGKMFIQSDASIVIDDGVFNDGPSGLILGFASVAVVEDVNIGFASVTDVSSAMFGGSGALTKVVIRLGTVDGEKGLFVNEDYFPGEFHAEYLQNRFYVGSPGQSISWFDGTLTVEGNVTVADGSITAEKVDFTSVFAENIVVQPSGSISSGFDTVTGLPTDGGFWLQGVNGPGPQTLWIGDDSDYIKYSGAAGLTIKAEQLSVESAGSISFVGSSYWFSNSDELRGASSVALGADTASRGFRSTAIGSVAVAYSTEDVALGFSAEALAGYGVAIGTSSRANTAYSVAIGQLAVVDDTDPVYSGTQSVAIGHNSFTGSVQTVAIGDNAEVTAAAGVAVGAYTRVNQIYGIAIGGVAVSNGGVAIGTSARAGLNSIALGHDAIADSDDLLSIHLRYSELRYKTWIANTPLSVVWAWLSTESTLPVGGSCAIIGRYSSFDTARIVHDPVNVYKLYNHAGSLVTTITNDPNLVITHNMGLFILTF